MEDKREQEVRDRSKAVEEATEPGTGSRLALQRDLTELKKQFNDSMEILAEKIAALESQPFDGQLCDTDLLKVVGFILSNEKLAAFLADRVKEKIKAERTPVKVSFEV